MALCVSTFAGVLGLAACSSSAPVVVDNTVEAGLNCGDGAQVCGTACTVIARDPANCGACGTACKQGEVCSAGKCATSCGGGSTQCGSSCVNTSTDGANCGNCSIACKQGEVCSAGKCATSCGGGTQQCGQSCVNQQTDPANCGMCGNLCSAGNACVAGKCALSCQQGLTACSASNSDAGVLDASVDSGSGLGPNYCANLQTDNANCGGCNSVCGPGTTCINGACAASCGQGSTLCSQGADGGGSYCAVLPSDNANCGKCGAVCGGAMFCKNGACQSKFQFQLSQTIDGQIVKCSSVNNANVLYTECDDLQEAGFYFPNGITCGPMWSMTNSSYSDTVGFCKSLTGTAKMEAYYTCSNTTTRATWKANVWGTTMDNGYTQHVRCYY